MPVRLHHTSNTPFSVKTEKISEKDTVFLFSDGFADQFGGNESKKFRKQQMRELFKNVALLQPNEQKTSILSKFNIWKGDTEQIDDILILGFSIT